MIELKQFEELINNANALASKCENYKKELFSKIMASDVELYNDFVKTVNEYADYYYKATLTRPEEMLCSDIGEISRIDISSSFPYIISVSGKFGTVYLGCYAKFKYEYDTQTASGGLSEIAVKRMHKMLVSFAEHKSEFIEYFQKKVIEALSKRQRKLADKIDEYECCIKELTAQNE